MKDIKEIVTRLSGHRNRACYGVLCCAAEVVRKYQPYEPQMKAVLAEVKGMIKDGKAKKESSLSKALSRALDDIWESGDQQELEKVFEHQVIDRPTPRELVCRIAEYAWKQETVA